MSLTIISEPEIDVNGNSNTVSDWNAVHHPIKFGIIRKDFLASAVKPAPSSTFLDITIVGLGVGDFADFIVDNFVYYQNAEGSGTFKIVSTTGPDVVRVEVLATEFLLSGSGYINNLNRLNYFILTNVFKLDVSDNLILIGTSTNKTDEAGNVTVDVSSFLKSIVDYVDLFTYDVINLKDETLGGRYQISLSENWQGFEGEFSSTVGVPLKFFSNSAKQIGDLYGSNMGEFVPFSNYDPSDVRAKFLNDADVLTYFPNFPFSLSFIYSESIFEASPLLETLRVEEAFDVNGNSLGSGGLAIDNTQGPFVNRLMLKQAYPSVVDFILMNLETEGEISTEKKKIKIDNECKDFPLYLTWLNSKGGYSYWLFFKSHSEITSTRIENQYLKNVTDLETSIGQIDSTGKISSPKIDFGARVSQEDMQNINSLYNSPKVLLLSNPETWEVDGPKWLRVQIKQGSLLTLKTGIEFQEVNMSMLLPLINTQKE